MKMDRSRSVVVRAGECADHALAEVRLNQPGIGQEMLKILDHRPFEQDLVSFRIVSDPALDLIAQRRAADPDIPLSGGPQCVAQAALHVAEGTPAAELLGCEPDDLCFAARVVVPELNAGAVVERYEHS